MPKPLVQSDIVVIKIGSALLRGSNNQLNLALIDAVARQISALLKQGIKVLLVSSGAIAEGLRTLNIKTRPKQLHTLQALAAIGQMRLVHAYEKKFQAHGFHTAQILLTHGEMSNRERYLNAKTTILTLLDMGVVPVINENDAVANDEIQFGDNDTLAALAVTLVEAKLLLILTDQQGMYDKNPSLYPNANLLKCIDPFDERLDVAIDSTGGVLGSGGMLTKLKAARQCAQAGANTVIAYGMTEDVILKVLKGENIGTLAVANETRISARKRWLLGQLRVMGRITIDEGAHKALNAERSLLSVGVLSVSGEFKRGDLVAIEYAGNEIARGLINFGAYESMRICGVSSKDIESVLGYAGQDELIHKDNLVLKR